MHLTTNNSTDCDLIKEIAADGTVSYFDKDHRLHREDGPAIIYPDGSLYWFLHGVMHRTDGPAMMCSNGVQQWWFDGHLHRTDGPAIISANGTQHWCINGEEVDPIVHFISSKND